jgi:hypothetical protein
MFQTALISAVLIASSCANETDSEAEFGLGGFGFSSLGAFNEIDYLGLHNARVPQKSAGSDSVGAKAEEAAVKKEIIDFNGK